MAGGSVKVGDFCSAYFRRHGRMPEPPSRRIIECQAEAIVKGCGKTSGNALAELDLETRHESDIVKKVRCGDAIVVKAGRGTLRLSFTHIDGSGRLVCMAFNSGQYESEHQIREGETEKVWGGMLPDMRVFRVTLERLPLMPGADGALGCVRIRAEIDSSQVRFDAWPP
jgi:hypothetical protein